MSEQKYYPEDILVEKMESGEFGWLDYVNHYSAEWQEEYSSYCEENGLSIGMNRQLSLSVIKMLNLKLRWKTEKHRKTTNKRLHTDYGDTNKYQSTGNGSAARNAKDTDA